MEHRIDAKGLPCPTPVILAKKAIDAASEGDVVLLQVDNEIAVTNLRKLAASQNAEFASMKLADKVYEVRITTGSAVSEKEVQEDWNNCRILQKDKSVVVLSSSAMGEGDEILGKLLMKGFIYALTQLEELPETVLLYNGGAFLSCEDSDSLDDLRTLEKAGVEILTCGTCLNHYGIAEKLAVGSATNMYVIAEKQMQAGKIIRP